MKIAILSDIHGNYDALIKVLEECEKTKLKNIFSWRLYWILLRTEEFGIKFVS